MKVCVCMDNHQGMMFNHRRLSRDRILIEKIGEVAKGRRIFMNSYSCELFDGIQNIVVNDDFLSIAGDNDICFVENQELAEFENKIDSIIIFKWNRSYPADTYFDLVLDKWHLVESCDFEGYSHDKITKEVYER